MQVSRAATGIPSAASFVTSSSFLRSQPMFEIGESFDRSDLEESLRHHARAHAPLCGKRGLHGIEPEGFVTRKRVEHLGAKRGGAVVDVIELCVARALCICPD